MSIAVAIVEDSRTIRESLRRILDGTDGLRCIWTAGSGEEALQAATRERPDVILMDIHLPKMSGIACTARIKRALPGIEIIMLTIYEDNDKIFSALQAGACGYLLKRAPEDQLIQAIKDITQGGAPMTSEIARRLVATFQRARSAPEPGLELSPREKEVLELVSTGYRNKEIADKLSIGMETVRHHLKRVYDKLHVHSRTEAVVKFFGIEPRQSPTGPESPDWGIPPR